MKKLNRGLTAKTIFAKPLMFSKIRNLLFPFVLKLRLFFARKFETSKVSNLFEKAYNNFLCLPLRTVGLFFISFSSLSAMIDLYSSQTTDFSFVILSDMSLKVLLFLSSILLLTSKAPIGNILSSSLVFPILNVDDKIFERSKKQPPMYSQALFVGLIFGCLSSLIHFNKLFCFILICVFSLICYSYPESGVLITGFLVPLTSGLTTIFTTFITLISFIFKYLRGKRHGTANAATTSLIVFLIYVCLSLLSSKINIYNLTFISAILFPILSANLINSSRLSKKLFAVIYTSCAIKLALNAFYILLFVYDTNTNFLPKHFNVQDSILSGLFTNFESLNTYIVLSFPLVFSMLYSSKQFYKKFKYLLPLLFMAIPIIYSPQNHIVFAILLSTVLIISVSRKYLMVSIVFVPIVSKLLTNLLTIVSSKFHPASDLPRIVTPKVLYNARKISNILFGKGLDYLNCENYNSFALALISAIGILGLICMISIVIIVMKHCLQFIFVTDTCAEKSKEICVGVFAMLVCFLAFCFTKNIYADSINISVLFSYIALAITCIKCSQNDYIDRFHVREYNQACGTN